MEKKDFWRGCIMYFFAKTPLFIHLILEVGVHHRKQLIESVESINVKIQV